MRCEIIAVGTELLLGQITDTNSAWMGEQLALAGIDSHFQTKVGDNLERIIDTIKDGLDRSDAIIMCGGLGPTQDDLTRDAIATMLNVGFDRDPEIAERIRDMFEKRGRAMPENNLRQADVPRGTSVIPQMPGTAPGLICPIGDKVIYAVPGVPGEMKEMVNGTILEDLKRRAGVTSVITSRVVRTWGQSESGLAETLAERITELDRLGNPTLAFQASGIEGIKLRITAKTEHPAQARTMLDAEEQRLREMLGDFVFGIDAENMEVVVLNTLRERGLTLAVAESLTGGLVGARLTGVPGASDVFRGAVVSYASEIKHQLLNVPDGPVVSESCAKAMAAGVRETLGADIGIATTGVAGPAEQDGQPVGTVFLGVSSQKETFAKHVLLPGARNQIREYAVISLLNLLRLSLVRNGLVGEQRV